MPRQGNHRRKGPGQEVDASVGELIAGSGISLDGAPKYDIRDWAPEHARMGKGVTLTEAEARALYEALKEKFGNN